MRIKLGNGLLLVNILSLILILVIHFNPTDILRMILGLPFVLFFPGYSLIVVLFQRKEINNVQRIALSLVISIALAGLIGLILNYTSLGIRLESILWSLASFTFILSVIAWYRSKALLSDERFSIQFTLRLNDWGRNVTEKVLTIILVLSIIGALGVIGYVLAKPKAGESFTEFYFLGQNGKAEDYINELRTGEEGKVIVGIANHESETVTYTIEIMIDGVKNNEVNGITLANGETWENEVSFTPQVAEENCKVAFFLYRTGESTPMFDPLQLWVNITF